MKENSKSISEKVGKKLKSLIKQSKFKTQDRFANEGIHVSPVTVRRWIAHGVRDINTIEEISQILEIDIMELLGK